MIFAILFHLSLFLSLPPPLNEYVSSVVDICKSDVIPITINHIIISSFEINYKNCYP